ncbi:hypothetical protein RN001_013772, partial [Aquatica leii]
KVGEKEASNCQSLLREDTMEQVNIFTDEEEHKENQPAIEVEKEKEISNFTLMQMMQEMFKQQENKLEKNKEELKSDMRKEIIESCKVVCKQLKAEMNEKCWETEMRVKSDQEKKLTELKGEVCQEITRKFKILEDNLENNEEVIQTLERKIEASDIKNNERFGQYQMKLIEMDQEMKFMYKEQNRGIFQEEVKWKEVRNEINGRLEEIQSQNGNVLTGTLCHQTLCDGLRFYGDEQINPNIFIRNMEQGIGKMNDLNRIKETIRKAMRDEAADWFNMIEPDITNFKEFKEMFLNKYWGRWNKGNDRGKDIIMYMREHFEEDINRQIGIERIKSTEELLGALKYFDSTIKFKNTQNINYKNNGGGYWMHDRNAESWHKNNYYNRDRNSFSNNDNYYDRQGRRDENIKHSNEGNRLWNRNKEGNQYWDKRNNYVNRNDDRQRYNREENKDRRSDEGRFERRVYRNNNITRGRGVARDQERNVTGHLNNVNVEIKKRR